MGLGYRSWVVVHNYVFEKAEKIQICMRNEDISKGWEKTEEYGIGVEFRVVMDTVKVCCSSCEMMVSVYYVVTSAEVVA